MHWNISEHDWLEGRDEKLSQDRDASLGLTTRLVAHDSTEENLQKLGCCVKQHGRPVSVHTDQASLFQIAPGPAITGMIRNSSLIQIGQALQELNIAWIEGRIPTREPFSPQKKAPEAARRLEAREMRSSEWLPYQKFICFPRWGLHPSRGAR